MALSTAHVPGDTGHISEHNTLNGFYNAHPVATTGTHGVTGNIVGDTDTQTLKNKTFSAPTSTGVAITVKGVSTQTGDLEQWQDSSGNVLAKMQSNGVLAARSVNAIGTATTDNPLLVNAVSGQTGNLALFQVNGATMSYVAPSGTFVGNIATPGAGGIPGTGGAVQTVRLEGQADRTTYGNTPLNAGAAKSWTVTGQAIGTFINGWGALLWITARRTDGGGNAFGFYPVFTYREGSGAICSIGSPYGTMSTNSGNIFMGNPGAVTAANVNFSVNAVATDGSSITFNINNNTSTTIQYQAGFHILSTQ